jgi:thiamine-phosphate pyrophosphorylase
VDFASACLDGGARFLQVRAKDAAGGAILDAASRIVERAASYDALVVVNDRADIARLSGAAGVHVGQDDLTPGAVRRLLGPDAIVGLSTHSGDQCRLAMQQAVSYLAVGPVFLTDTKATGYQPIGPAEVRRAAEQIGASHTPALPLVAIGGVTLQNASSVIEAGARAVAVISDLLRGPDPSDRVRRFLSALGESK